MFPQKEDYPAYFGHYLSQISPEEPILNILQDRLDTYVATFKKMPEDQLLYRYAEGKWSIKEIIGHLIDAERIMAYRALRFARNDKTDIPGFDENIYVPAGKFDARNIEDLLHEWQTVRAATISLLNSLDEESLARGGKANGLYCTANAMLYIIAAHQEHHINVINDRYMKK